MSTTWPAPTLPFAVRPDPPAWVKLTDLAEDRAEWDAFVAATGGDIVQSSKWGMSKRALGHGAFLVEVRDIDGAIAGGALTIEQPVVAGARIGYVARGPVARDRAAFRSALAATVAAARARGYPGLIVQLPEGESWRDQVLAEAGFLNWPLAVAPEATLRIDLALPEEAILGQMSSMRRRNLRKVTGTAVRIEASDDVAAFHRLHAATAERQGFAPLSLEYLESQWRAFRGSAAIRILLARAAAEPVAGLWLSRFGQLVTFRLAGWDSEAKVLHVNEALHWAAIRWARSAGARFYDFGGIDRDVASRLLEGQPLPAGIESTHSHFKLGFSRTPILLPTARALFFGAGARLIARLIGRHFVAAPFVRRLAQRLRSA
jgi:hypothetical protein